MSAADAPSQQVLPRPGCSAISKNIPHSEVSRHCIPEDCWVAINGKVYDLTEFADRHPGGPTMIMNSAGKDVSKMYNDIHKGVMIDRYLRPEAHIGDYGVDEDLMTEDYWQTMRRARIEEIQEELKRLLADKDEHPSAGAVKRKPSNITDLLHQKELDGDFKAKIQTLETQKRVALDSEDYEKASSIKAKMDLLLSEAKIELKSQPRSAFENKKGGIPLSEVARHNKPHDAWIAIQGKVYDLTDFLLQHPEQRNSVLAWAGRDATAVYNKIPGRFPSATWMEMYLRPEADMGEVGAEPYVEPKAQLIRDLQRELRRLEGPSEEEVQAAKAGGKRGAAAAEAAKSSEESRFPKLAELAAKRGEMPFFTRAEVAKHKTEPYMILHNKVYDLTPLMGSHPGGDELLLTNAGVDATKEFELFEHSEKARVRRDQDMLVGEIVPAEQIDYGAEAAAEGAQGGAAKAEAGSELAKWIRYKAADAAIALVGLYLYKASQHRKPLPKLMYSRALRHWHLIMATGIFTAVGSVQAAAKSEGLAKKRWLQVHKQSGAAMLVALIFRIFARMNSGIPPRFPGNPTMMKIETASLRLFYVLCLILPVSGIANEYYLKWAEGDDAENDRKASQAMTIHKRVGQLFEYAWLPLHLGYTTAYHWSKGRGVVRKVSPFI